MFKIFEMESVVNEGCTIHTFPVCMCQHIAHNAQLFTGIFIAEILRLIGPADTAALCF